MLSAKYPDNFHGTDPRAYLFFRKLIDLRSQMCSSEMGRFLTMDSWKGDYTTPMSYNAWLYGYANPVPYTDPTGKYPEEFIMEFMGADTWADVIKQFQPGGRFTGNWGWLEVMRRAEDGDLFYTGIDGEYDGYKFQPTYKGKFAGFLGETHRPNGQVGRGIILVDEYHDDDLVDIDNILYHSYVYQIRRKDGAVKFNTKGWDKYYHVTFNSSKVNWLSFSLDAASTLASIIPGGSAAIQGVKYTPNMVKAIKVIGQVNKIYSFSSAALLFINGDPNGVWLNVGSAIAPGPVGAGFSIGCMYHDLEQAIIITP